jgi:hypothetical protein
MPELSRNDPCSCGSGKKFKKCCMESLAKAASPRTSGPSDNRTYLKKAMDLLLETLQAGRLPELGGDPTRFDALMNEAIAKHGLPSDNIASVNLMFAEVAPRLWPDGLGREAELLEEHSKRGDVTDSDRTSWRVLSELARTIGASENPVARALFTVQMERWAKDADTVRQQLREVSLRVRAGAGAASPEQLENLIAEESKSLAALSESRVGRALIDRTAEEAAWEVARSIDQGKGQTLLAADEWLWLAASVDPALRRLSSAQGPEREAANAAFVAALAKAADDELLASVIERAEDFAAAEETPRENAAWYRRAVAALKVAPDRVLLSAMGRVAAFFVTGDREAEKPHVQTLLTSARPSKEGLEAYRKFLLEHGETKAAERLGKASALWDEQAVDGRGTGN